MNMFGLANDDLTLDLQPRKSDKLLCWPLSLRKFSADVQIASRSQEHLLEPRRPSFRFKRNIVGSLQE